MLMPKRVRRRKVQRGRMKGKATRGNTITYGDYAIQAMEPSWITSNQIEAARIAMTRYSRRGGKVWIKVFPDKPVTSKPAETRMGSGKGSPDYWVAVVKPGRVLFEIAGVTEEVAREAMRLASHKLPCKTKFIKRDVILNENTVYRTRGPARAAESEISDEASTEAADDTMAETVAQSDAETSDDAVSVDAGEPTNETGGE